MMNSIRGRFFLAISVLIVVLGGALALTFHRWNTSRSRMANAMLVESSIAITDGTNDLLAGVRRVERQIALGVSAPGMTHKHQLAYLRQALDMDTQFSRLSLILSDRTLSVGNELPTSNRIREDSCVRAAMKTGRWSANLLRSSAHRFELHSAAPVTGLGVLLCVVPVEKIRSDLPPLRTLARTFLLSPNGAEAIAREQAPEDVVSAAKEADVRGVPLPGLDPGAHALLIPDRGLLASATPIPELGWKSCAVVDENRFLRPLLSQERQAWWTFVAGAATTYGFVWLLTGSILGSIARLRRAAQAIAGGDIGYRIRFSVHNEIDALVQAFNEMAERLEAHQDLLHDRNQQLNVLLRVVEGIRTERDPRELLRRITQDAAFVTMAGVAFLALAESDLLVLQEWWDGARWVSQPLSWHPGQGAPGWVWLHNDTLTSESFGAERHESADTMPGIDLCNYVCSPISGPNGAISGVLFVANKAGGSSFTEDDIRIMELLARHAGVALEVEAAFQRERRVAATLQKAMLPDVDPNLMGLQIAREYQAATEEMELGGDFYDVIELPGDRVGLVIADVSGKGLRAAVQTAAVKYALRAYALEDPDPSRVLQRLNRACTQNSGGRGFVTLFYGVIDTRRWELVFANAGHQPPLLRRMNGKVDRLSSPGVALGVVDSEMISFASSVAPLRGGDTLVLYTDGLSEARSGDEFLDTEGLQQILGQLDLGAGETARMLLQSATRFAEGALRDDVALLVTKIPYPLPRSSVAHRPASDSLEH